MSGLVARLLLGLIRGYQLAVSPLLGPRCRFSPTCSSYAARAIRLHGPLRGSWLAVRRIARCHPFHPGGLDPVPAPGARPGRRSATMDTAHGGTTAGTHEHPQDRPLDPLDLHDSPHDLAPAAAHPDHARPATRPGPGG